MIKSKSKNTKNRGEGLKTNQKDLIMTLIRHHMQEKNFLICKKEFNFTKNKNEVLSPSQIYEIVLRLKRVIT